jgi:hypothetical protein
MGRSSRTQSHPVKPVKNPEDATEANETKPYCLALTWHPGKGHRYLCYLLFKSIQSPGLLRDFHAISPEAAPVGQASRTLNLEL